MKYITTPHEAELNAAEKMRQMGFSDAQAAKPGADGGIDVRSKHALAQVKWRGGVAGRPDMQKLYGARGMDSSKQLFFFAASGYSKAAIEYANKVGIALYVYEPTGEVQAVNKVKATVPTRKWSKDDWWIVIALTIAFGLSVWLLIMILRRH